MWWFCGVRFGSSSFLPLASSDLANEALAQLAALLKRSDPMASLGSRTIER